MKNPFKKDTAMPDQEHNLPVPEELESHTPEPETVAETEPQETDPEARVRQLQQQLDESRNRHLYLLSDFENYKRHAAKERMELIQTAGRDILTALVPILDDFDRAAKNGALTEGVALIHHKLWHTLQSKGLHAMTTKPGDVFNADRHEAVAEVPAASDDQKGKIVDVLEQGYMLGERIIRFAKVVVGK
jgi:molecular chaperone GrpE